MPSPTDPILVLRRRAWLFRILAAAAIICAAGWAWRPSSLSLKPGTALDVHAPALETETSSDRLIAQLDPKVFTANLWNPKTPPAPPPAVPAPAQPSKPDITLVAVIERSGGLAGERMLQAALYDPAEQRVRVFEPGATIRQYTIADVTSGGVTLIEGQWRHELRLREERPPTPLSKLIATPHISRMQP